jgi:hypothetical protein
MLFLSFSIHLITPYVACVRRLNKVSHDDDDARGDKIYIKCVQCCTPLDENSLLSESNVWSVFCVNLSPQWNTFLVVLSLRHLLAERKLWADSSSAEMDEDSLDERKISSGIRASAMLLPLLAISWFLGVVALENASSIFFQIAAASANIALVN